MKANELMIGDWVGSTVSGKAYQVLEIGDPFVLVDNPGGVWLREIGMKYRIVEPIPLTVEIFEKNGWHKSSDGGWHTLTTKDNIYLEYHWGTSRIAIREVLGVTEMVFLKGKRFVHELQHALRLCGLNELADNFKI